MDKGFQYHRAVSQFWAEMARNLAESVVLPLDIKWYSVFLTEEFSKIKTRYNDRLMANGATLGKQHPVKFYHFYVCIFILFCSFRLL